MSRSDEYVVLGAGITGLYTAYCLLNDAKISPTKVTVIAQYLPGDQSIHYTSPWAGGNFSCITPNDPDTLEFDKYTYTHLHELQAKIGGPEKGIDHNPTTEYWDVYPGDVKVNSLKTYLKDLQIIPKFQLPAGVAFGIKYTTWDFFCPFYLANIKKYLEAAGVTFIKQKLTHISQAYLPRTKVVFNCTGIGAFSLSGVKDSNVYPTRGQVLVVHAPHIQENRMRWGEDYATYIIPRAHSNGQLILGGFLQKDNWTGDTSAEESKDIIKRTTELMPEILDRPLEILAVAAGLRPSRYGGVRIETERVEGKLLIHNYGASGYGYQSGFGMAHRAVQLLLKEKRGAKL
ncbi:DEKNAAC105379 [Brettanomyces naardenensis]|uniref:DEKNAAC105379 n=1 Tax=Brettanomyces naardenensis TaxID=13370 RepID=A0A448YTJ4_BRENA|nr:DEKNAAC105379 [Brettanomyces naardenensis]